MQLLTSVVAAIVPLFVCFVGLYAGHPYIQLISFEIFLLSCVYSCNAPHARMLT